MNINKNSGNIFLLISITTDKMSDNVTQSYKLIEYDPDIQKVDVPLLSFSETNEAVKLLLGRIGSLPPDFSKKIFDHSGGNFRKLMMYLDEFFQSGVLAYVSGILLFRNRDKFKSIIEKNIGRSVKNIVDGLDPDELAVLKLLCTTFNKLTSEDIQKCIPLGEYELTRALNILVNHELISGYDGLYKAIKSDVKDYVFKLTPTEELTGFYKDIIELGHDDKFSKYASIVIKRVTGTGTGKMLNTIDAYIDKLIK